jgi:hypothetical protein
MALVSDINSKMFSRTLFLISFIVFSGTCTAQVFSLEPALGLNACQIHGDNYTGYNKVGLFAGTCVNARINDRTSFQLGFYFSQKGARHNPNYKTGNLGFYRLNLNYIDLPLSIKFFLNAKYYATAGPSIAYLISHHENINYSNVTGNNAFEPYEIGLNFGMGTQFKSKFNIEVRCSNSISAVYRWPFPSTVYYTNPIARFFNKGFYNNILTLFVSYKLDRKSRD